MADPKYIDPRPQPTKRQEEISKELAKKIAEQKEQDASDAKEAADLYRSKSDAPHESDSGILGPGEQRTTPPEEGGDTFEEIQQGIQQEIERDNPGAEQIQQGTEDIAEGVEQLTGQPPAAIETTAWKATLP